MALNSRESCVYYELTPTEIAEDINKSFSVSNHQKINIMDVGFILHPHVYPSHRFRSTYVMLDAILDGSKGRNICEIGCGCGTLGQIALKNGASKLVQGDINPHAINNAKANKKLHGFSDKQLKIYESDCFDNIPLDVFDLIIFAMPYHNDDIKIMDPLLRAFYDPNFTGIKKFLIQAVNFSHSKTKIYIAFSNKGDTKTLENVFEKSEFKWELFKIANRLERYDNRIYRLSLS